MKPGRTEGTSGEGIVVECSESAVLMGSAQSWRLCRL
jgi:hypothetical protein